MTDSNYELRKKINDAIELSVYGPLGSEQECSAPWSNLMTERNLRCELLYSNYIAIENGDDKESIDYRSLIHILTELMSRVEKLEARLNDK